MLEKVRKYFERIGLGVKCGVFCAVCGVVGMLCSVFMAGDDGGGMRLALAVLPAAVVAGRSGGDDTTAQTVVEAGVSALPQAGVTVQGDSTVTKTEQIMDKEYYLKEVNKKITEMKFTGSPIDQILRHATSRKSSSLEVKYYSVGQRPVSATLTQGTTQSQTPDVAVKLEVSDPAVFSAMDTIIVKDKTGMPISGYMPDGVTRDAKRPLMLRVHKVSDEKKPLVFAINGLKVGTGTACSGVPALPKDAKLYRLARAAGEKDVKTAAYYNLPTPEVQIMQRYICQVEQSLYERMVKNEADWNFDDIERLALEDFRIGIEASGLFSVDGKSNISDAGNVYTTGGIYYRASKDLVLGSVPPGSATGEAEITEDGLVDFMAEVINGAGNGSRTKYLFAGTKLYSALCKIKTNKTRMLNGQETFTKFGLDFEKFSSMGTTLLVYRHDMFDIYDLSDAGLVLDIEFLDKWEFKPLTREEFDLRKLAQSNSEAVTFEEMSCWTLSFPDAHARVKLGS